MTETKRQSEQNRAENELIFKNHNIRIQQLATTLLDGPAKEELLIGFICECSDEKCHDRLHMPVIEFTELRQNPKQFIIKNGHEQTDIERVVSFTKDYQVVEKYEEPFTTDGKLNKT